jgi:DNA-binding CsgD family transcriptional regulator
MQHVLLTFYVLFFASGFMGFAALLVMGLRMKSRLIRPLLLFQSLFLAGLGIVVLLFYLQNLPDGVPAVVETTLMLVVTGVNAAVYLTAFAIVRILAPSGSAGRSLAAFAEVVAVLVVVKSAANGALMVVSLGGTKAAANLALFARSPLWSFPGFVLSGAAMILLGIVFRTRFPADEPVLLRPLMRAYGLCAVIFAPLGFVEFAVSAAGIPGLPYLSIDHLFYLAWNIVSMSAAVRLFRPGDRGVPALDSVPAERVRALGLSNREAEMAVHIARGLANKEIAAELDISPATVRTHIYNLYQKVGARSRVELLNKLRD